MKMIILYFMESQETKFDISWKIPAQLPGLVLLKSSLISLKDSIQGHSYSSSSLGGNSLIQCLPKKRILKGKWFPQTESSWPSY